MRGMHAETAKARHDGGAISAEPILNRRDDNRRRRARAAAARQRRRRRQKNGRLKRMWRNAYGSYVSGNEKTKRINIAPTIRSFLFESAAALGSQCCRLPTTRRKKLAACRINYQLCFK